MQVEHAKSMLPGNVNVVLCPQDDSWFRDTGPIVSLGRIRCVVIMLDAFRCISHLKRCTIWM